MSKWVWKRYLGRGNRVGNGLNQTELNKTWRLFDEDLSRIDSIQDLFIK
jgi:hypothetical protein